jgi:hypothetical protein
MGEKIYRRKVLLGFSEQIEDLQLCIQDGTYALQGN